jgi:hypothetical protein
MSVIDMVHARQQSPTCSNAEVAAARSGSTQVVLLQRLVSGRRAYNAELAANSRKAPGPESRENRNISGSQKTVLILLTPGKQLFPQSLLHCIDA